MSRLVYLSPDEVADAIIVSAKQFGEMAKAYRDYPTDDTPEDLQRTSRLIEAALYNVAHQIRDLGRREDGS